MVGPSSFRINVLSNRSRHRYHLPVRRRHSRCLQVAWEIHGSIRRNVCVRPITIHTTCDLTCLQCIYGNRQCNTARLRTPSNAAMADATSKAIHTSTSRSTAIQKIIRQIVRSGHVHTTCTQLEEMSYCHTFSLTTILNDTPKSPLHYYYLASSFNPVHMIFIQSALAQLCISSRPHTLLQTWLVQQTNSRY